ncbi:peptidylprolyl isomerase RRD1, partial [Ascoidea rubescens DSM 1968]
KNPNFIDPIKRIHDSVGTGYFQNSLAIYNLKKIMNRIIELTSSIECPENCLDARIDSGGDKAVSNVLQLLDVLSKYADEIPPFQGPRRYGNLADRDWHKRVANNIDNLLKELLIEPFYKGPSADTFLIEIKFYVLNSFGSKIRLDYGTGHELNFIAFIGGLWMCDVIKNVKGVDFILIFSRYYDLVRKLILNYTLEPAGSHGVWGLDDHFHFSYILGASQFVGKKELFENDNEFKKPMIIRKADDNNKLKKYQTKNLFFNSISFIIKVKRGAFWEHSPMLYDISGIKTWRKILRGLMKMYYEEVLDKFPVIQHFYFGGVLYPWIEMHTGKLLPENIPEE